MSGEEISTTVKVVYDVQGIDRSIQSSQRLLYSVNALRLAVVDFQRLSEDPSLGNMLWTGIQLTRVWNNLHNLVKATNQAQRVGMAQGAARGAMGVAGGTAGGALLSRLLTTGAPATGVAQGAAMQSLFGELGFGGMATAALGGALSVGVVAGLISIPALLTYNQVKRDREHKDWRVKQREIAKLQGLEP